MTAMKKEIASVICLALMTSLCLSQEPIMKPFAVKSGIIEYSYSGDKTGTGTLWFDDYGMKSALYMEIFSEGKPGKGWIVTSGDYQYMWDPDKVTEGKKMKNPLLEWMSEPSENNSGSLTEQTYSKMGMKRSGQEVYLGKDCDIIKGDMGKVLIWKGILMVMDLRLGAYVSGQKATSVKTDVPVEAKYFELPKNITFTEMTGF